MEFWTFVLDVNLLLQYGRGSDIVNPNPDAEPNFKDTRIVCLKISLSYNPAFLSTIPMALFTFANALSVFK